MSTATANKTISFAALPAIGAPLDGGVFFGVTTNKAGVHCAAVLLPEQGTKLTWKKAIAWAAEQDAELPSRPVASMLFANLQDKLQPAWHWTSEEDDASYAWYCHFLNGYFNNLHKSYVGSAVAVRMIPLTA